MKVTRHTVTLILLVLVFLLVVTIALVAWQAGVRSHRAATYGITDPQRAALRIENKSSEFAISRITIGDATTNVFDQDLNREIGMGTGAVLELEPGDHIVRVYWVESAQVEAYAHTGDTLASFHVSPGKAAILHLIGGRATKGGLMWIPPELVLK